MCKNDNITIDELERFKGYLEKNEKPFKLDMSDLMCPHIYERDLWSYLRMFKRIKGEDTRAYMKYTPKYVEDNFNNLNGEELINSIFYLIRAERFCSGAIACNIKNIEKSIKRLLEIWR